METSGAFLLRSIRRRRASLHARRDAQKNAMEMQGWRKRRRGQADRCSPCRQWAGTRKPIMKIPSFALLAASTALLPPQHAQAAAGQLDPTFGQGGVVIVPTLFSASPFDRGNKVLIQSDGKILLVGRAGGDASGIWRSAFVAMRFNVDGTIDTSFGPDHDGVFILTWPNAAEARAVLIDINGDIVVGGNEGPRAAVVWLHADGTIDASQGAEGNGTANFAVNQDDSHTTALNAMTIENRIGGGQYQLDFAGSYDGAGNPQMMLGSYVNPGPYYPEPNPFIATIVPPGTNGNGVATALIDDDDVGVIAGGYVQNSSGSTQCVVAQYSADLCTFDGDGNPICGWFPNTGYGNEGGAFVDQFFSGEFNSAAPCYIDDITPTAGGAWTLATGREFFPEGIRALYFSLDSAGNPLPWFNVFAMTTYGDNSPRAILPEDGGKWILAGFSGADSDGTSDPVVARVDFLDGTLDGTFGFNGVSLLDFDPQDNAHGETYGAALDAHGCVVSVGTYFNGASAEGGNDESQIFVSRTQGDAGGPADTLFANGFDPPTSACGP
jgi:uncharacterized delta-60 repeat protein